MISIKAKAYKAILQNQTYIQDVTSQVCNNTTTPSASIKIAGNASDYNTYATEHSDTEGIHGVEIEAQLDATHRNYVPEATLIDRRSCDSNGENCTQTYLVRKLADGKCWMVQNMELDLEKGYELTTTLSDVSINVIPITNSSNGTYTLSTKRIAWAINDNSTPYSYNPKYDSTNTTSSYSGAEGAGVAPNGAGLYLNNSSGFFVVSTSGLPTERRGNSYNWRAATVLSGSTSTSANTNAPSSICPKEFKMPLGGNWNSANSNTPGSFYYLENLYGVLTSANAPKGDRFTHYTYPISFVPAGSYYDSGAQMYALGTRQWYWTRTKGESSATAFSIGIHTSERDLFPGVSQQRFTSGHSVRCVSY